MKNSGIQSIKINKILSRVPVLGAYARGGMVTKFKVEKGQSKWIRKFIEQMRNK